MNITFPLLPLTSYPVLCFVTVHRFSWWLFDPIRCSALRWSGGATTGGLQCFCWGLCRRLACGCGGSGFTIGWLFAKLEAAGELFMLEKKLKYLFEQNNRTGYCGQYWNLIVCVRLCVCVFLPLEPPQAQWALLSPPWTGWYVRHTG